MNSFGFLSFLTGIFTFLTFTVSAQNHFIRSYSITGSSVVYDICKLPTGNLAVGGSTRPFFGAKTEGLVFTCNQQGDTIWTKLISHPGLEIRTRGVITTADSAIVSVSELDGTISTSNSGHFLHLAKFSPATGDTLWSLIIGDDLPISFTYFRSIQPTSDGGFILTASMTSDTLTKSQAAMLKFDADGILLWRQSFNLTYSTTGLYGSIPGPAIETFDGGYFFGFTVRWSAGNRSNDLMLVKTDPNGSFLWSKVIGKDMVDALADIKQMADSSYLVLINTYTDPTNVYNPGLMKLSQTGNVLWVKTLGDNSYYGENAFWLDKTSDGGYVFGGSLLPAQDEYLPYFIKVDNNGDSLFTHVFSDSTYTNMYSHIIELNDGGFLMGGGSEISMTQSNATLFKFDGTGNQSCVPLSYPLIRTNEILTDTVHPIAFLVLSDVLTLGNLLSFTSGFTASVQCMLSSNESITDTKTSAEVFPNPSQGIFKIKFNHQDLSAGTLNVFNSYGCLVYSVKLPPNTTQHEIRTTQNPGLYFYSFNSESNSFSGKIVLY